MILDVVVEFDGKSPCFESVCGVEAIFYGGVIWSPVADSEGPSIGHRCTAVDFTTMAHRDLAEMSLFILP